MFRYGVFARDLLEIFYWSFAARTASLMCLFGFIFFVGYGVLIHDLQAQLAQSHDALSALLQKQNDGTPDRLSKTPVNALGGLSLTDGNDIVVEQLVQFAERAGLSVKALSVHASSSFGVYQKTPMTVLFSGHFHQFFAYISHVSRSNHFVVVDDFSFFRETTDPLMIDVNVVMYSYAPTQLKK